MMIGSVPMGNGRTVNRNDRTARIDNAYSVILNSCYAFYHYQKVRLISTVKRLKK